MKRIGCLLLLLLAFACSKEKQESVLNLLSGDISMEYTGGEEPVTLQSSDAWNGEVSPASAQEWLSLSPRSGNAGESTVRVRILPNETSQSRSAGIVFSTGDKKVSLVVSQQSDNTVYRDKDVVRLQEATLGRGINIVLLGDGYVRADMAKGSGKYETDMRTAMEAFFSVYPFNRYRSYFNVYMVGAVSAEAGMSVKTPSKKVDTKFGTVWDGGTSTGITYDRNKVVEFIQPVLSLTGDKKENLTVIMPINEYIYAGTTELWTDGYSVAMCPVGAKFREIVTHEAGGHGFAKLADEYIYYEEIIPSATKTSLLGYKASGFYPNIDFSSDIAQTTWSGFAGNPKYSMVSTFEGAYKYRRGIWRPEQNSCMNDNVPYFNAPGRWAQVKRIYALAGMSYSFAQFLVEDEVPAYAAAPQKYREPEEPFVPLGDPIVRIGTPD